MASNQYETVSFGSSKAGLVTVGYTIYDHTGAITKVRTTTGVQDLGGGQYGAVILIPDGFIGRITWDTGGSPLIRASSELNTPDYQAINDAVIEAVQHVTVTVENERIVVGGCARSESAGRRMPIPQSVRSGYRKPEGE